MGQYSLLVDSFTIWHPKCFNIECTWVVKIRNTSGHNTPLGHHTGCSPMGLGQYEGIGEYCSPHTASFVFLMLVLIHFLHFNMVLGKMDLPMAMKYGQFLK